MRLPQSQCWSKCPRAAVVLAIFTAASTLQPLAKAAGRAPSPSEGSALHAFDQSTQQYIKMEHALPADKLKPTSDIATLETEREALRKALQAARPNAKQGDLFTPDVAKVFRRILARTMAGSEGAKIRASLAHAEPLASVDLKVNVVYPNINGQPIQSVPPTLLQNLPRLPKGLEYSIAGKTLALRDADANMVVDLLPDALP
jgi:hypothetical protein